MGDFQNATSHYKQYIGCRDSVINEANTKRTVQAQMHMISTKKQTADSIKMRSR